MMVVKEPVEDKVKTTSVLFGLIFILGGFFFWKIMDLSSKVDLARQESKEDFLLFTDDLRKTQKKIIDMETVNGDTNNKIEKVSGEIVTSKKLVAEAVEGIAALRSQVKKISDSQVRSSKTEAEFKKTQDGLRAALEKLDSSNAELNRLKNQSKEMNQTIAELKNQVEDLKSRQNVSFEESDLTTSISKTSTKKPWWKFWGK